MGMIITIEGHRGEGKNTVAEWIATGLITSRFQGHHFTSPFWSNSIAGDCQVVIVDDIKDSEFENILSVFKDKMLVVHRKGMEAFMIPTPDAILIKKSF